MMNFQMPTQQPINQYYQQPYMQNPYMQRMENLQQFQQAIQPQPQMQSANNFTPLGKIVDSVDIVKATDIPMDGNMYYFPKADGSMVFGKQWLANGQTRILTFKAVLDEEGNNLSSEEEKLKFALSDEFTDTFKGMFDTVIERIDKLEKSLKPTSKTKKEVSADE